MRRGLGALLALPAIVWAVFAAVPAFANGSASIDHAEVHGNTLQMLVSVPSSSPVDPTSVQVTIGGTSTKASAVSANTSNKVGRTAVLAIDTSDSMSGVRIAQARKAALAFLDAVPANVKVGIVTFAATVNVAVQPTLDRAQARAALDHLQLSFQTRLYDGLALAVQVAGNSGQRQVLLLTDGMDTTNEPLSTAVKKVHDSGVEVNAVALPSSAAQAKALRQIAKAGNGTLLEAADPKTLAATYAHEAQALAHQVLVTAAVPASQTATDAVTTVQLSAGGQTYTDSAYLAVRNAMPSGAAKPAPPARPELVEPGAFALNSTLGMAAIGLLGVGLVGLLVVLFSPRGERRATPTLAEHIGTYGVAGTGAQARADEERPSRPERSGRRRRDVSGIGEQATEIAAKVLANNRGLEAKIAKRLEAAAMALRPAEWVLLHASVVVAAGLVGILLGGGNPVLGVLFLAGGIVGPWIYLALRRARRLRAFDSMLADTLQLMSSSLSAGLSLAQSLDTIVREGSEPVSGEFRRVIVETRLGVNLEDALEGVAERMNSLDFAWVTMAIRIQREVGGNLAELLLTVAATLREREYLRRHVRALSAEGRLSCWILGGLPPVFLLYLVVSKPAYVHPLFSTSIGWLMCVGMAVLLAVGVFWMSKVAKVEI